MSERRHPNVANVAEVESMELSEGSNFGARIRGVGRAAGSVRLGGNVVEVPPGRSAFPCHYHCGLEEAIFVLDGVGRVRIGKDEVEVRAGDWISFPIGPEYAHRLDNTGDEPLHYLCISDRNTADVVGYPDSGKILASASGSHDFFKPPWVRAIFKEGTEVGYYDGEETGE